MRRCFPPMDTCTTWRSVLLVKPGGGGRFRGSVNCGDAPHVPTHRLSRSAATTMGWVMPKVMAPNARVVQMDAVKRLDCMCRIVLHGRLPWQRLSDALFRFWRLY